MTTMLPYERRIPIMLNNVIFINSSPNVISLHNYMQSGLRRVTSGYRALFACRYGRQGEPPPCVIYRAHYSRCLSVVGSRAFEILSIFLNYLKLYCQCTKVTLYSGIISALWVCHKSKLKSRTNLIIAHTGINTSEFPWRQRSLNIHHVYCIGCDTDRINTWHAILPQYHDNTRWGGNLVVKINLTLDQWSYPSLLLTDSIYRCHSDVRARFNQDHCSSEHTWVLGMI